MDMIGRIRRLRSRKNKSEREIARITGLSRNTVAKWLHGEVDGPPKYRRAEQTNKLSVFHEALKLALTADARRPKRERRTAKALYAEIKGAGCDGGYTRVTDFIRAWRQGEGQGAAVNAFIPLAFELGEAFQFDWSEEGLVVGGIYYRMQVSHMKLCASRAFWLVAYPSQGHEMLFDAHTRSFAALGGIARRGIYDNMKTAVDKVKKGKGRIVNERFATMCAHYLVEPDFCNVASGWEKGVVARNRYSVPCELHGQMVSTRLYPASVVVVADDKIVARHDRLSNAGETRYDWQHYIPLLQRKPGALRNGAPFADMPEPLQRLRRALLRNPGGDRVMAQVLAIVLTAGLEAVLVAVELALETGPPGKVSVEHVVNVLGRLNAAPVPPTAATQLKVTTPPLANTARYDSLRGDNNAGTTTDNTTEGAGHEA